MSKINVTILGAAGRMGIKNMTTLSTDSEIALTGAIDVAQSANFGKDCGELCGSGASGLKITDDLAVVIGQTDVVVDFSLPVSTMKHLEAIRDGGAAMIIGTTGFSTEERKSIEKASLDIPVILSGNFSTGINLLMELVRKASAVLDDYDVEIVEKHHNQKVDSPSGTARMLGEAACESRDLDYNRAVVSGRAGNTGKRTKDEIGMFSVRGGGIIGEHSVTIVGEDEKLELSHCAFRREAFSSGVLKAVKWIKGRKPGMYTMRDVLGFS